MFSWFLVQFLVIHMSSAMQVMQLIDQNDKHLILYCVLFALPSVCEGPFAKRNFLKRHEHREQIM